LEDARGKSTKARTGRVPARHADRMRLGGARRTRAETGRTFWTTHRRGEEGDDKNAREGGKRACIP